MGKITAVCSVCRATIPSDRGVLAVDLHELPQGRARWRATHTKCHPNLDVLTYGIELGQVNSAEGLRWWDEHLSGKTWLKNTDWFEVSSRARTVGHIDTGLWWPPVPPGPVDE